MVLKLCGQARNMVIALPACVGRVSASSDPNCLFPLDWGPRLRILTQSCVYLLKGGVGHLTLTRRLVISSFQNILTSNLRELFLQVAVNALSYQDRGQELRGPTGQVEGCSCACLHVFLGVVEFHLKFAFNILPGKQVQTSTTSKASVSNCSHNLPRRNW